MVRKITDFTVTFFIFYHRMINLKGYKESGSFRGAGEGITVKMSMTPRKKPNEDGLK